MKPLDHILVPVDFGPNTDTVVEEASKLAKAFRASLRLLYVIEVTPRFENAQDLLMEAARGRLRELHGTPTALGVPCEPSIAVVGKPADTIVHTADSVNAHLIVMGRGRCSEGGHSGLGATTSKVLRATPHPVLTVAPESAREIRRILCPVDGSNASARGLHNGILLAAKLKARLTVLTVIPDLAPLYGMARRPDIAKVASDYQKMERDQFEQFIHGFDFGGVTWDKEVHFGHPADEIVQLASDAKYDLVVMGSTGRSGLPRVLLGSTAETVARRVACSVLTVKREDILTTRIESEIGEIKRLLAEGHEFVEQGQYDSAISRFDQCLLKDPYLAAAIEGLAAAHERLGHADVAADLHEQAALIRCELWSQHEPSETVLG
jgi:nucleotide-binding universal stress UspA family protein